MYFKANEYSPASIQVGLFDAKVSPLIARAMFQRRLTSLYYGRSHNLLVVLRFVGCMQISTRGHSVSCHRSTHNGFVVLCFVGYTSYANAQHNHTVLRQLFGYVTLKPARTLFFNSLDAYHRTMRCATVLC